MSANLLNEFMKAMGPQVAQEMTRSLGVKDNDAMSMIPQVMPLILGGLNRQSQNHGGADRVNHILNKYGDANVLGDVGGLFSQVLGSSDVTPQLGGLLGTAGDQATEQMANQFGLDMGTAAKIIPMLSPLILGFLSNKRDNDGAGASGIAALIDQDGDGSILDDVAGFLLNSGNSGGGGLLGGLLGGLFGGKR